MKDNTKEILLGMKENRNRGPSFQPSSFVVLSSTSLSLPKWVWSLLAVGFLLLSSFTFFIWPGCGFPGYKVENSRMIWRHIQNNHLKNGPTISISIFLIFFFLLCTYFAALFSPADGINWSSASPPLSLWLVLTVSCCSFVTILCLALSNTDLITIESS